MSVQVEKPTYFRHHFWRMVLCIIACLLGCLFLIYRIYVKNTESKAILNALAEDIQTAVPVEVMELTRSDWESWRTYYGRAKAVRTQEITSYVREIIDEVRVDLGDKVEEGQVLLTLINRDHAANTAAKMSVYEEAKLNYNRLETLYQKNAVAKEAVEKAYALMKSEEANAINFASTLERTELKAKINGIVALRGIEAGEIAEPGKSLLVIIDPSEMDATLLVSKKHVVSMTTETPVEIHTVNGIAHAWVKRVGPKADEGSGLYPVVVGIDQASGILPGAYVEGRMLVAKENNILAVPSAAVMFRGGKRFVYTATPDSDSFKARLVEVTLGDGAKEKILISSGLNSGELLIISGSRGLSDGLTVTFSGSNTPVLLAADKSSYNWSIQ